MAGYVPSRRRLVLVPLPFQGHINPMLQLATVLHSRGFSITIVHTHFNSPNPFNHPHFTFESISDGLSHSEASTQDIVALLSTLNDKCQMPLQQSVARLVQQHNPDHQIVCIISDALMYCANAVANHLKLPIFNLRTGSTTSVVAYTTILRLLRQGYLPLQDPSSQSLVPELHPLRDKDLPESLHKANSDSFLQILSSMIHGMSTSSGIIWNTFDYLEDSSIKKVQQYFPVPIFSIGPLNKHVVASSTSLLEEETSCLAWLDKQDFHSVIYVSFGSLASMDEKDLVETAWGIANSEQPFLWVIRPGSIRLQGSKSMELLPKGFKEMTSQRGCIVKWAPQQKVLAHPAVGGFWTHNGWNSTLETISEGVPMICWPCFADQMMNARYVSHVWKVGLQLENGLERGEIERTIKRLMVDEEGKKIRDRAMDLKDKAELCLRKGGSSYTALDHLVDRILAFSL